MQNLPRSKPWHMVRTRNRLKSFPSCFQSIFAHWKSLFHCIFSFLPFSLFSSLYLAQTHDISNSNDTLRRAYIIYGISFNSVCTQHTAIQCFFFIWAYFQFVRILGFWVMNRNLCHFILLIESLYLHFCTYGIIESVLCCAEFQWELFVRAGMIWSHNVWPFRSPKKN